MEAGKVLVSVSRFLAGGSLIALNKNEGCPPMVYDDWDKETEDEAK